DNGWLRFWVMESGTELMSYIIGFVYNNIFYYWLLGYAPTFSVCSPGRLLLVHVLRCCFNEKIVEFDFMRGEEKYKQHWATGVRYNMKVEIYHYHWRSWFANLLSQGKRYFNSS
ncbi:MAG: GNAT family N-acetyltransferase, partial [Candidatus Aenigmarchaeota archaeon]|nr:GNAT family N-acetyltransferase [Candidatus Aenigmarchaeota archaeon]